MSEEPSGVALEMEPAGISEEFESALASLSLLA
jgi:hypothetical protein